MKDNFSGHSDAYKRYRPAYPQAMYDFIMSHLRERKYAWDCGTGNGQVAAVLADLFDHVEASDISKQQLDAAIRRTNISYTVQAAEQTEFPDKCFDLVIVAQAIHWFDFERFYTEARRTMKKGALIAVCGYGLISVNTAVDAVIKKLYTELLGNYWDMERRYIDEDYKTIPFPFEEIGTPELGIEMNWTYIHLLGYLNTWSAVKHFIKANGRNPVEIMQQELKTAWGGQSERTVYFRLLFRLGRITTR